MINKSAIKNFAIEARNILIKSAVTEAGFYGITKDEIKSPIQKGRDFEVYETLTGAEKRIFDSDVKRRAALVEAIHQKGFDEVMEETAYTWFNRLIAIRFMEVNNYLPFRMRVLSSDSGSLTPDIVSRSLEVELNLTDREQEAIQKAKDENSYDEAFRLLFITTCNELNDILPGLFEKTDDYMELLLKLPYTSDGVVRMLVDTIPESNFNVNEGGQVEIIGWLYQYYNTEPKAKAFAKKGKITKEEIPAVTQLFTPDWIVRYMVENSLGRLWVEHLLANGDSRSEQEIANDLGWKYYLPEAEQEPEVQAQLVQIRAGRKDLTPEDILCIDPCQGSGHILVYLFDVLMQIYREDGYSERDAARCILEHNLYGLDIDDRAYQLSYFAVLMKARQYDRMILKKHIQPHVYSIQESNNVNRNQLKYFGANMSVIERNNAMNQLTGLLDTFKDAKEYGSILNVDRCDWNLLRRFAENERVEGQMDFDAYGIDQTKKQLATLIEIGETMSQKYHVVTTNPPYMKQDNMPPKLEKYIYNLNQIAKYDTYAAFILKCNSYCVDNGLIAMITMHNFMYAQSYIELRRTIFKKAWVNMLHLGARAFSEINGEVVQTASYILRNRQRYNVIDVCDLTEEKGEDEKKTAFLEKKAQVYRFDLENMDYMPGYVMGYPLGTKIIELYKQGKTINKYGESKAGVVTGADDYFIKQWSEIDFTKIEFYPQPGKLYQYVLFSKGGTFEKWYGNSQSVLKLRDMWDDTKTNKSVRRGDRDYYYLRGIGWSQMGGGVNKQYSEIVNAVCKNSTPMLYPKDDDLYFYLLAYLNSGIPPMILKAINPTLSIFVTDIMSLPFVIDEEQKQEITNIALRCYSIYREVYAEKEEHWEFKRLPIVTNKCCIGDICKDREEHWALRNDEVEELEYIINQKFRDILGFGAEIKKEYPNYSIRSEIIQLLSYAVGCMFGRYSLDVEGLAYAGGDWNEAYATKYKTFMPDTDAIIPITDEEYFKDDIVARFVDFIRIVYGEETLEENLKFIADALGNKGDTPRAVIRNYFLNDFYKDHCNTYSVTGSGKRPIYWLFDSGKQNGFKALIYIHRYTPDTVGLIRSVYLHNAQAAIQNSLQNSEYIISTTTSATERARETRKKDKYVKQLNELRPYYQALSHIALQRIPMDLDDGVKKNYQLFQGVEVSTEGKKKQTIDLLAKI